MGLSFENGLIGNTGLVGSNIVESPEIYLPQEALFHSRNIGNIGNISFGNLICSAARGTKWKANKNPTEDSGNIEQIQTTLSGLRDRVGKLILISTIDIYPDRTGNEETASSLNQDNNHSYGRHRRELELFVAENFPDHLIVRLPGLFGNGLNKNPLYDLITGHRLSHVNPESTFQFLYLQKIGLYLRRMLEGKNPFDEQVPFVGNEVNLVTQPITMGEINDAFFQYNTLGRQDPKVTYDVQTCFQKGGYFMTKGEVISDIDDFLKHGSLGINND